MKKLLALAMVLSVLGSIVAGCGKGDDTSGAGSTTATPKDSTPKDKDGE